MSEEYIPIDLDKDIIYDGNTKQEKELNRKIFGMSLYINDLQQELSKYKSKLDKLNKCYIDVFTKIEDIQKNIACLDIRELYQGLIKIKDIIKFYIPEVRKCDGSE